MTIKHKGKNISGEPEWIITDITDNTSGILTITLKNQWNDQSQTKSIDLSKHKLQLVKLNNQNHLELLKNGSLADINSAFVPTYIENAFEDLNEVAVYRESKIFLVLHETTANNEGIYREYMWINNDFEVIGSTDINLEPFFLKSNVYNKLDYSTNDNTKALSAYQGYILNQNKIDKTSIATNLTTSDDNQVLSAKQGKTLQDNKQEKTDNTLNTTAKTIVGAINEHETDINNINTNKQDKSNIVTSWSNSLSDVKYPSEKLVKNNLDNKVDKEQNKSLMTDAERTKLNGIETEANKTIIVDNLATNNATQALSAKQGKNLQDNKVDKVTGKQLSTEDYTATEKTKLSGIEDNATKNILFDIVTQQPEEKTINVNSATNNMGRRIFDTFYDTTEDVYVSCIMKLVSKQIYFKGGIAISTSEPQPDTTTSSTNGGTTIICAGVAEKDYLQGTSRAIGVNGNGADVSYNKYYKLEVFRSGTTFRSIVTDIAEDVIILDQTKTITTSGLRYWSFHTYEGCNLTYKDIRVYTKTDTIYMPITIDIVEDGNVNPISSNAVYDYVQAQIGQAIQYIQQ